MPIKKGKIKEKKEIPLGIVPQRQYTIFYTINGEKEFFVSHGTSYEIEMLNIKSTETSEISSFPVVTVIDSITDTVDIIPMASVANIRHNWTKRRGKTVSVEVPGVQYV